MLPDKHRSSGTAYAHFNQPLAHPLGANFVEYVGTASYSLKRWSLWSRVSLADLGYDYNELFEPVNYGNNVLLSYEDRPSEYGNEVGQGLSTQVLNADLKLGYLVNPASNLMVEGGVRLRSSQNDFGALDATIIYFGFRNSFGNRYLDF